MLLRCRTSGPAEEEEFASSCGFDLSYTWQSLALGHSLWAAL